jgi:hypothetical protein
MMRTKLKIRADQIAVAWQGGAWGEYAVERGTRLRGDHPMVKHLGEALFVPDGTPENEWPTFLDGIVEDAERTAETAAKEAAKIAAANPPAITERTTVGELVQCIQGILASKAGSCPEGTVLLASDPRVGLAPEAFRPLLERLTLE